MVADDQLYERIKAVFERWRRWVKPGREGHIDAAV